MIRMFYVAICFATLIDPVVCYAQQGPSPEQVLRGLLTGDKLRDRMVIEAFQRGYQRGLQDSKSQCDAEITKISRDCQKPR